MLKRSYRVASLSFLGLISLLAGCGGGSGNGAAALQGSGTVISGTQSVSGKTSPALNMPGIAPYHLVRYPSRSFTATYTDTLFCPNTATTRWLAYFPIAPELPSQSGMTTTFSCTTQSDVTPTTITDASDLKRGLFQLQFPVSNPQMPSSVSFTATISGTLYARDLAAGPMTTPAAPLSTSDAAIALETTTTLNYNDAGFQAWLNQTGLRRLAAENDVDFARRALQLVSTRWDYEEVPGQDRRVSHLITVKTTDCGGASALFVAILRANSLPARLLIGRWSQSADPKTTVLSEVGQCHVKSEFFAYGIGWVPIEASGAISSKNISATFGHDNGQHLAFHVDPDLIVPDGEGNPYTDTWMQGSPFWVWWSSGSLNGYTDTESWTVTLH